MKLAQPPAATIRHVRRDGELPLDHRMRRDLSFEVRAVNEESRTVELSFSSEQPYERWWGTEILDHGPQSVRLGRLNSGAALLVNHDTDDQVGVVERAWLDGRRGRAIVRFGRSAFAEEVFQDVRDGIRKLVSVGYQILSIVLESTRDGQETYRVTEWEPYEISLVAVPADATVGVDRDADTPAFDPRTLVPNEDEDMNRFQRRDGAPAPSPVAAAPAVAATPAASPVDLARERNEAAVAERARSANIRALAARLNAVDLGEAAVADGRSVDAFVEAYNERASTPLQPADSAEIGMSEREVQSFSFLRAINALANPTDRGAQRAAAFEFECSAAAQDRAGRESRGLMIPLDVLRASLHGQRDLVVGTATAGGNLVETTLDGASFISMLRNALALQGLGARMLTDLSGNLAIPRMTGGATCYWVGENAAPTESQPAFDQVALTPKTLGAFTDIGRRLMLQSSVDVEGLVRQDLALAMALEIDRAAVNGSGSSNQPRGVLNTVGIASEAGGTNGLAPTWDNIVNLETKVANANAAIGSLGYLTNTKVRGKLKLTQKFSGTNGAPVWEAGDQPLNGYQAAVSNQVPSNLTKGTSTGVCSAILFGNWADLLIGMWGGLDLLVDPYTGGTAGTVRVSVLQDVDTTVRHPESFSAMVDALAG